MQGLQESMNWVSEHPELYPSSASMPDCDGQMMVLVWQALCVCIGEYSNSFEGRVLLHTTVSQYTCNHTTEDVLNCPDPTAFAHLGSGRTTRFGSISMLHQKVQWIHARIEV